VARCDVLITGAGGFIGGALTAELLAQGHSVRAVDVRPLDEWSRVFDGADNRMLDLREREACYEAAAGARRVFNLAADMGGVGYITANRARCMLSVLINTQLLMAARDAGAERYFYASSACVYPLERQASPAVVPLREADAYPADPEDGYGWEKLFDERMCKHFRDDFGLETRVARYHNVYGPHTEWTGGREKAPAALCRKVAEAVQSGRHEIEIWGDGRQTRSFTYIDDCVTGTLLIASGDDPEPINVGSSELVTIDGVVDILEEIAGVELERRYAFDAPQGVRGRNSDNTRILDVFGWEPSTTLRSGLATTYEWVAAQVAERAALEAEPEPLV
jgi:GDP-D-mannose 3', 5'-epimerase